MTEHAESRPQTEPQSEIDFQTLVSRISHDARNSTRALIQLPQWIKEDLSDQNVDLSEDILHQFDMLNTQASRLDALMRDMVVYFRVGTRPVTEPQSIRTRLYEVLKGMTVPDGFKVTQDIEADEVQMSQEDLRVLLECLLSNGVKHHTDDAGTIRIATRQEGDDCVLTVQDDGPGLVDANVERIFEPLRTQKPKDDVEGSGMGLSIVKKIAEHYGGSVRLMPEGDLPGACFEVRFTSICPES